MSFRFLPKTLVLVGKPLLLIRYVSRIVTSLARRKQDRENDRTNDSHHIGRYASTVPNANHWNDRLREYDRSTGDATGTVAVSCSHVLDEKGLGTKVGGI